MVVPSSSWEAMSPSFHCSKCLPLSLLTVQPKSPMRVCPDSYFSESKLSRTCSSFYYHSELHATRSMPLQVAHYEKYAILGACHRTSNGQEHKLIRRAGPEQDTIFHLCATASRGRGSHRHDERLAWVASWWQRNS